MKTMYNSSIYLLLVALFFIQTPQTVEAQEVKTEEITEARLQEIINHNKKYIQDGKVANYIPELGKANPNDIAIAVVNNDGELISVGDTKQTFTIQSISKIIGLMIAVEDHGEKAVFDKMGYFGTNKAFNYYANLDTGSGQPLNPLMNAGAILTTSMIEGNGKTPYKRILERIRYITKNDDIKLNTSVYHSEKSTGNRNRGIFYLLKSNGLIDGDESNLDNYFRQCSIAVSVEDLAKIGYFFAHDCVRFDGDDRYKNSELAELIQSQMLIAGMYDFSGDYARTVGLPSKSGVGGGISVSVPGVMGIGTYSPALDAHGNSIAGYHMLQELANRFDLTIFK